MPLTVDQVKDQIKLKKVAGVWGISIPSDFVSAEVDIKVSRKDKYSKCKQDIKDSIKFGYNSNGQLGIKVKKAGDMDKNHSNQIGLKTVFDDQYDDNGVALVDFDIGNVSTNYNSGDAPSRTETDTLNINKNDDFYKFDTLEGRTDGGNVIDYQDYLKNGSTSNWDGRELPDISSDGQKLDFHDNDGSDNNARMTFTSKDVEFNEKPSLTKIEVQKGGGTYGSKNISNDTGTIITRTVQPSKRTFYQINLTVGSGDTPNLISSNRDGSDFYRGKKAIFIRDNCNGDNNDDTDYKNTLIFISNIKNVKLTGTPPPVDDPDPIPDPDPDPDPTPNPDPPDPIYEDVTVGGPCPTNPNWSNGWPGGYRPTCPPAPATATDPGGVMSLQRDPSNKRKVSLTFTDIPAGGPGQELRKKLNLNNTAADRSLKNKLITIKVTYAKRAGWQNSFNMTASCSDIREGNDLQGGGSPYSRPTLSRTYAAGSGDVDGLEYRVYNIDGSSTVDFVFSSVPPPAPTRTRYDGQTETVTETSDGGDPPTITTTTTITCIPPGGIFETYSPWPVCPEEVYVTRTGGTLASAVYSDGASDGANDQFIDIELIAIRESATELDGDGIGVFEELEKFVWIPSSTPDTDDNLGVVDGKSLYDYDEHSDKIRFRNPTTRTSATDLATNGTGICELKDHSGAFLPGTIDTKIAAASSLPINLSY